MQNLKIMAPIALFIVIGLNYEQFATRALRLRGRDPSWRQGLEEIVARPRPLDTNGVVLLDKPNAWVNHMLFN